MPFLNKFSKRMNLAIKSTNHYRKKQEGIVMINGYKVELLQVCQALKNTGLLDLESDIEKLLSSKQMAWHLEYFLKKNKKDKK